LSQTKTHHRVPHIHRIRSRKPSRSAARGASHPMSVQFAESEAKKGSNWRVTLIHAQNNLFFEAKGTGGTTTTLTGVVGSQFILPGQPDGPTGGSTTQFEALREIKRRLAEPGWEYDPCTIQNIQSLRDKSSPSAMSGGSILPAPSSTPPLPEPQKIDPLESTKKELEKKHKELAPVYQEDLQELESEWFHEEEQSPATPPILTKNPEDLSKILDEMEEDAEW